MRRKPWRPSGTIGSRHTGNSRRPQVSRRFSCHYCSLAFARKSARNTHETTHADNVTITVSTELVFDIVAQNPLLRGQIRFRNIFCDDPDATPRTFKLTIPDIEKVRLFPKGALKTVGTFRHVLSMIGVNRSWPVYIDSYMHYIFSSSGGAKYAYMGTFTEEEEEDKEQDRAKIMRGVNFNAENLVYLVNTKLRPLHEETQQLCRHYLILVFDKKRVRVRVLEASPGYTNSWDSIKEPPLTHRLVSKILRDFTASEPRWKQLPPPEKWSIAKVTGCQQQRQECGFATMAMAQCLLSGKSVTKLTSRDFEAVAIHAISLLLSGNPFGDNILRVIKTYSNEDKFWRENNWLKPRE